MPTFKCNKVGSDDQYSCVAADFCGKEDIEYVIMPGPFSLDNWVSTLDLTCRPAWQIGLFGSAYFSGWCSTLLWMPKLADVYGRKNLVWLAASAGLLIYTTVLMSRSYWVTIACIFLIGAFTSLRNMVGFTYLLELMGAPYKTMYGTIWGVNNALSYFWATLYFWFVSKDSFKLLAAGYAINVAAVIGIYYLPESPAFLVKSGRIKEATKAFLYIANFNKTKDVKIDEADLTETNKKLEQAHNQPSTMSFLQQPAIRRNLGVMAICFTTFSFNYYMVSFLLKYFPGNMFVNSAVSSLSDVSGNILGGIMYASFGAKRALGVSYSISILGGFGILLIQASTDNKTSLLFPALVLIAKLGMTSVINILYVCNNEFFPVLFASTALGFCNFFARLATMLAPQVAEIQSQIPMVIFTGFCGLAAIAS